MSHIRSELMDNSGDICYLLELNKTKPRKFCSVLFSNIVALQRSSLRSVPCSNLVMEQITRLK